MMLRHKFSRSRPASALYSIVELEELHCSFDVIAWR